MNRLTEKLVSGMIEILHEFARDPHPLIITGNQNFFSVGADLGEIAALTGPQAYEFSKVGQRLMNSIQCFPAPVYAAVLGHCMGGGLDLALACHWRIASRNAVFGHRGASLGLVTGWGGTQRLPRLIGKARALQMLVAAERIHAQEALQIGLVDALADDPLAEAARTIALSRQKAGATE
jgi:enoyl-CoA hydratase/carnithine racemase